MRKKIQKKIEELLFEVYEKGLQQETTDLTAYYEKIKQALNIHIVSNSVTCENCDEPTSEGYCSKCYDAAADSLPY